MSGEGFVVEGVRRASLRIGKQAIDELTIALVLDPADADSEAGVSRGQI